MRSNLLKLALIGFVIWFWLPTGPSDVFIIPFIISRIGFTWYAIISIAMVLFLYRWIDGATLGQKVRNIEADTMAFARQNSFFRWLLNNWLGAIIGMSLVFFGASLDANIVMVMVVAGIATVLGAFVQAQMRGN